MAGLKTSIDQEKIIFAYALKRPQYLAHMGGDFFTNADIQYLANCAKLFFQEYKESPSCEQMKSIIKGDKKELAPEIVDSIYDVEINAYEEEWLQNITEGWIKFRLFNHNMFAAATLIKTADITLDNVNEIVERAAGMVGDTNLLSFDNDLGDDFFVFGVLLGLFYPQELAGCFLLEQLAQPEAGAIDCVPAIQDIFFGIALLLQEFQGSCGNFCCLFLLQAMQLGLQEGYGNHAVLCHLFQRLADSLLEDSRLHDVGLHLADAGFFLPLGIFLAIQLAVIIVCGQQQALEEGSCLLGNLLGGVICFAVLRGQIFLAFCHRLCPFRTVC